MLSKRDTIPEDRVYPRWWDGPTEYDPNAKIPNIFVPLTQQEALQWKKAQSNLEPS